MLDVNIKFRGFVNRKIKKSLDTSNQSCKYKFKYLRFGYKEI